MNILILSAGTRNKIVQYFVKTLNGTGKVIATDMSNLAPAIYEADKYYIVPKMTAPEYLDVVLDICKKEEITGVLSLIDPELSLLAERDTVWIPTISPVGNLAGKGLFDETVIAKIVAMQKDNVRKAFAMGVHVGLGSDAGAVTVPHVEGLFSEYEYLLAAADGDKARLDGILETSEAIIKEKFRRH